MGSALWTVLSQQAISQYHIVHPITQQGAEGEIFSHISVLHSESVLTVVCATDRTLWWLINAEQRVSWWPHIAGDQFDMQSAAGHSGRRAVFSNSSTKHGWRTCKHAKHRVCVYIHHTWLQILRTCWSSFILSLHLHLCLALLDLQKSKRAASSSFLFKKRLHTFYRHLQPC